MRSPNQGSPQLALWLVVVGLMGFSLLLGIILAWVVMDEGSLSCPPQTMQEGAKATIKFSYPQTPEDTAWMAAFNAWTQDCAIQDS